MKTLPHPAHTFRHSRKGSAVLVMLVLLSLMLALAAANSVTLNTLHRRLKIIDHAQLHRLSTASRTSSH